MHQPMHALTDNGRVQISAIYDNCKLVVTVHMQALATTVSTIPKDSSFITCCTANVEIFVVTIVRGLNFGGDKFS